MSNFKDYSLNLTRTLSLAKIVVYLKLGNLLPNTLIEYISRLNPCDKQKSNSRAYTEHLVLL